MSEQSTELLSVVRDIRALLELLAEPAIAQRDAKFRLELRRLVGGSEPKRQSVLLMDGTRRQKAILAETSIRAGHLSALVSQLSQAKLLTGDPKLPKLAISVPRSFFDSDAEA